MEAAAQWDEEDMAGRAAAAEAETACSIVELHGGMSRRVTSLLCAAQCHGCEAAGQITMHHAGLRLQMLEAPHKDPCCNDGNGLSN